MSELSAYLVQLEYTLKNLTGTEQIKIVLGKGKKNEGAVFAVIAAAALVFYRQKKKTKED